MALLLALCAACAAQPFPKMVGVEVGGDNMFIDVAKTLRPWGPVGSAKDVPTDENFWPKSDCLSVMYDNRPVAEWAGPAEVDDPTGYRQDMGGIYKLSLNGQARIIADGATIANQIYDPDANLTTADIVVRSGRDPGMDLLILTFRDTRRTPDLDTGTGFTNLKLIRPGYDPNTDQVFTTEFLASLRPFSVLRFMGLLDTNNSNSRNYDRPIAEISMNWSDRHVPTDATQQHYGPLGAKHGLAWEYVVQIANLSGKDLWVNVPVSATDDYVRQLAQFFQDNLRGGAVIYLEHSNEVWNFGFPQYVWNKVAAQQEVAAGASNLNSDGSKDPEVWARRRHARRLTEIARIIGGIYSGPVRPVYASWTLNRGPYYSQVLDWVNTTLGAPNTFFYAIAKDGYFGYDKGVTGESIDSILTKFRADSDSTLAVTRGYKSLADQWGLQLFCYEGGPGYEIGTRTNLANRITAARDPRMREIVSHHIADNWLSTGAGLFMYFAQSGKVSRYGQWGAIEDITNPLKVLSPKMLGITDVNGAVPPLTPGLEQLVLAAVAAGGSAEPLTCNQWNYYFQHVTTAAPPACTADDPWTAAQYWDWLSGS